MKRRDFIKKIGAGVAGVTFLPASVQAVHVLPLDPDSQPTPALGAKNNLQPPPSMRFGFFSDAHYADKDPSSRVYRDSDEKVAAAVALFNSEGVDFAIEGGDFKDFNTGETDAQTLAYLAVIETEFQKFNGPTYHVLGNHDMDNLSKTQFLTNVTNTDIPSARKYYSFDKNGVHCVVLDANYRPDGVDYDHNNYDWTNPTIPQHELNWLTADLAAASGPVIVFCHQLLDGEGSVYIENASAVRTILENSGKVAAVFNGHHHSGSYNQINGIHYYTIKGLVEGPYPANNVYTVVEVIPGDKIVVTGYVNAVSKEMAL